MVASTDVSRLLAKLTVLSPDAAKLAQSVKDELAGTDATWGRRRRELKMIADQLEQCDASTSEIYHPKPEGLTAEQVTHWQEVLKCSFVGHAAPALDRLVNSIDAGLIERRVDYPGAADLEIEAVLASPEYAAAMTRNREAAFAYGMGYLVPAWNEDEGEVRYWHLDPMRTVLVTDPMDVATPTALFEVGRDGGLRFVTRDVTGWVSADGESGEAQPHGFGFLPAIIYPGRDRKHRGEKYAASLIVDAVRATIRATRNNANMWLIQARQTWALLVMQGTPIGASTNDEDSKDGKGKWVHFAAKDEGDAKYITPESRLEDALKLTDRHLADAAVGSGLPLDTFRPELVAGQDASATAARIRAFPLMQRVSRLVRDAVAIEQNAAALVAAVWLRHGKRAEVPSASWRELRAAIRPKVKIQPSLPEADAEELSNWQAKANAFFVPVEHAIRRYYPQATDEQVAELARAWRLKNDPTVAKDAEVFTDSFKAGVVSLNEARAKLGLAPVVDGDVVPALVQGAARPPLPEATAGQAGA